ncbi:MAG: hypothetical protein NT001_07040 [Candidatus Woesearchaeota archaeon]|nr:hypothetical protein [Candidatus Woesearchaeota archaeon]
MPYIPMRKRKEHVSHASDAISDTEKLKRKVQKLSAVLDFYEDLKSRKISNEKDCDDAHQKRDFAKKQMLKLCIEGKKIIKDAENKGAL